MQVKNKEIFRAALEPVYGRRKRLARSAADIFKKLLRERHPPACFWSTKKARASFWSMRPSASKQAA
jgi:hypothetical protein